MSSPSLEAFVVSTGGCVRLNITSYDANYVLTRDNVSLGTQSLLYSGINDSSMFLDMGDGFSTNVNYLPSGVYSYTLSDSFGSYSTGDIIPTVYLSVFPEQLDSIFIKLMKSAMDSLIIPQGYAKAQVYHAMPIAGYPPLPAIVIQQELLKQTEIPIGQQVQKEENSMTMQAIATRRYSVAALCRNSEERDFYRTAIIGCFEALCKDILSYLGLNIRHSFAVDSDMESTNDPNASPGFYYADCILMFDGNFNVGIEQIFPVIESTSIVISGTSSSSGKYVVI